MKPSLSLKLYVVLVFLSGVLVGGVGTRFYAARTVRADQRRLKPDEARKRYAEEMRTRLNLNAEQAARLDTILKATQERFKALREKYHPEVKQIQEEQSEQIRGILDDRQKAEYEKMRQEREKRRRESRSRGGARSVGV